MHIFEVVSSPKWRLGVGIHTFLHRWSRCEPALATATCRRAWRCAERSWLIPGGEIDAWRWDGVEALAALPAFEAAAYALKLLEWRNCFRLPPITNVSSLFCARSARKAPTRRLLACWAGGVLRGGIVCQIPGQAAALRQIPSNCRQIPDPARAPTIPLWLQRSERLLTNLLLPLSGGIISAILFPW